MFMEDSYKYGNRTAHTHTHTPVAITYLQNYKEQMVITQKWNNGRCCTPSIIYTDHAQSKTALLE